MLDWLGVIGKGGIQVWQLPLGQPASLQKDLAAAVREMIAVDYPAKRHIANQTVHSFQESSHLFQVDWIVDEKYFYVAIHPKMLTLAYVGQFLLDFRQLFLNHFLSRTTEHRLLTTEFAEKVNELLKMSETSQPTRTEQIKKSQPHTKQLAKQRTWDLNDRTRNKDELERLDFSARPTNGEQVADVEALRKKLIGLAHESEQVAVKSSGWLSFLPSFTGDRPLTEEQREAVTKRLVDQLVERNVAGQVATTIATSAIDALRGKGQYKDMLQQARKTIEDILMPPGHVEFEREIQEWRSRNPTLPYTVVFVGVNGVGKSTNLSKVCYLLMQLRYKVLIAACDTFRSGAVEQLKVHVKNLSLLADSNAGGKVELYQRGYGKDAAAIAKDALRYASQNEFDVLLVDTAGRMQDNEPLMRALGCLVKDLSPNKVLFVGEALVGTEATDQLANFNRALRTWGHGRNVNGILLTKFDTVDERVGAALSMSWESGAPVLFIGTGQTYTDLRRPNIAQICDFLLR